MAKAKKKSIVLDGNKLLKAMAHRDNLKVTHAVLLDETVTYSYSVRLENGDTDIITNECGRHSETSMAILR